uniref:Uncharacterized protein n=1 Tax=Anguilla anguilla TaxID=7936 RepID=A0A0E9RTN1_ANGAN
MLANYEHKKTLTNNILRK